MKQQQSKRKKTESLSSKNPGLTFGIEKNLAEEIGLIRKTENSKLSRYQSRNNVNRMRTEGDGGVDDPEFAKNKDKLNRNLFSNTQNQSAVKVNKDMTPHSKAKISGQKKGYLKRH